MRYKISNQTSKTLSLKHIFAKKNCMNPLNRELKEQAVNLGLCDDWTEMWNKDWDNDKLAERMYKGLDFCLKHHWPSNEFIKEHFDKDFLHRVGIIVDEKHSLMNIQKALILGSSEVTMRVNAWNHSDIYVRDESKVFLTAKNGSFVIVHLFDNASVNVSCLDKAHVTLIKHSDEVSCSYSGEVKVKSTT